MMEIDQIGPIRKCCILVFRIGKNLGNDIDTGCFHARAGFPVESYQGNAHTTH